MNGSDNKRTKERQREKTYTNQTSTVIATPPQWIRISLLLVKSGSNDKFQVSVFDLEELNRARKVGGTCKSNLKNILRKKKRWGDEQIYSSLGSGAMSWPLFHLNFEQNMHHEFTYCSSFRKFENIMANFAPNKRIDLVVSGFGCVGVTCVSKVVPDDSFQAYIWGNLWTRGRKVFFQFLEIIVKILGLIVTICIHTIIAFRPENVSNRQQTNNRKSGTERER